MRKRPIQGCPAGISESYGENHPSWGIKGFALVGFLAAFSMAVLQKVIQVNLGYLWPDYAFFS